MVWKTKDKDLFSLSLHSFIDLRNLLKVHANQRNRLHGRIRGKFKSILISNLLYFPSKPIYWLDLLRSWLARHASERGVLSSTRTMYLPVNWKYVVGIPVSAADQLQLGVHYQ